MAVCHWHSAKCEKKFNLIITIYFIGYICLHIYISLLFYEYLAGIASAAQVLFKKIIGSKETER